MRLALKWLFLFFLIFSGVGSAVATELDPQALDREALVKVFREIEVAINAQDIDRMVAQMDPRATVTWLNGEVSRGHDEIKTYYQRMLKGEARILDRYVTTAKLGASARFFGNGEVAVADGTMVDEFFPVARSPFRLNSHWTSTSAKINGEWKVVSLHLSANVFTNDLISEAKAAIGYVAGAAALAALVVGWLLGRWQRRKPQ